MRKDEVVKYTSPVNNYTGVMYGDKSLVLFNENGREIFHTGSRTINTYEGLIKFVDRYKPFGVPIEIIKEKAERLCSV